MENVVETMLRDPGEKRHEDDFTAIDFLLRKDCQIDKEILLAMRKAMRLVYTPVLKERDETEQKE